MYRHELAADTLAQQVIGIARTADARSAVAAATTMVEASLSCAEITLTNSRARPAIQGLLVSPHLDEPFVRVVQHLQSTIGAPAHA